MNSNSGHKIQSHSENKINPAHCTNTHPKKILAHCKPKNLCTPQTKYLRTLQTKYPYKLQTKITSHTANKVKPRTPRKIRTTNKKLKSTARARTCEGQETAPTNVFVERDLLEQTYLGISGLLVQEDF